MLTDVAAVLFDFDYTLADSSDGVCDCIDHALRQLDLPPVTRLQACRTIGLALPDTFAAVAPSAPPSLATAFARLFVERAEEVMVAGTTIYPGVAGALRALGAGGVLLGIVSTKYRRRIQAILRREGLADAFAVIVGGEDVAAPKPDPAGLVQAQRQLGAAATAAVYVGDSVVDAQTAARAGRRFVATLTGTTPRHAFAPYPVAACIEGVHQLPGLVLPR